MRGENRKTCVERENGAKSRRENAEKEEKELKKRKMGSSG